MYIAAAQAAVLVTLKYIRDLILAANALNAD